MSIMFNVYESFDIAKSLMNSMMLRFLTVFYSFTSMNLNIVTVFLLSVLSSGPYIGYIGLWLYVVP